MQKKILVVDDEYDIASTLELALEMEGHEVRLCSNGKEALAILAQESLPHLIISDIMMPLMNGYELAQEIRKVTRYDHIPLLLTSAAVLDKSVLPRKSYQGFIRKPFDLDDLLRTIDTHLA